MFIGYVLCAGDVLSALELSFRLILPTLGDEF